MKAHLSKKTVSIILLLLIFLLPAAPLVDFSEVRASLPSDTPTVTLQDREKNIRERRSQLQQRPLW
jgi:biopolymer transport protein ExbD